MKNASNHTFVVLAYKESEYLEECIKSVLNQSVKTNVVIATSTPNEYITMLAKKYNLDIIVNDNSKGIGYDFDFAINCANSKLVTVSHQDDIYDYKYAEYILEYYNKYKDATIIFPNYYEIKNGQKITNSVNLKIKRFLLLSLLINKINKYKFIKRNSLRFGTAIGCPSVTFVKDNVPSKIFQCEMKCDIDWFGWEKLSKQKGRFVYIPKYLMGHRIHCDSTTTEIIQNNVRVKEDYQMFLKFWPKSIAKILTFFYKNSEKNNSV